MAGGIYSHHLDLSSRLLRASERPMQQTAQLSQLDRETRYVIWNLVNCYKTIRRIPSEKACNR